MIQCIRVLGLPALAITIFSFIGCSGQTTTSAPKTGATEKAGHDADGHSKDDGHANENKTDHHAHEGDGKSKHTEGEHAAHKDGHADADLTEKDVKMPQSFKDGIERLTELHKNIAHCIEHAELDKVHRIAEEMALVAKKMKQLAETGLPEEKHVEAGRLCNEIAGSYKPIDEVADAGKKAETEAIHKKMGQAIEKLRTLAK